MTKKQAFEAHYADSNGIPVESMQKHRWWNQDGYRDPKIAAAYRNFCAGWDASRSDLVIELPSTEGFGEYSEETARVMRDCCADAIEYVGVKWVMI